MSSSLRSIIWASKCNKSIFPQISFFFLLFPCFFVSTIFEKVAHLWKGGHFPQNFTKNPGSKSSFLSYPLRNLRQFLPLRVLLFCKKNQRHEELCVNTEGQIRCFRVFSSFFVGGSWQTKVVSLFLLLSSLPAFCSRLTGFGFD